jgi:uncharacterized protein with von Willebrand factor type A (vWA) domain
MKLSKKRSLEPPPPEIVSVNPAEVQTTSVDNHDVKNMNLFTHIDKYMKKNFDQLSNEEHACILKEIVQQYENLNKVHGVEKKTLSKKQRLNKIADLKKSLGQSMSS